MLKLITALLAATASCALAETTGVKTVSLYIDSSSSEVDGKGVSSVHEGAGFNYLFAGTNAQQLSYYPNNKTLAYDIEDVEGSPLTYKFAVYETYVSLGIIGDLAEITFDSTGVLQLNGSSDGFYACKNTNDPYQYSKSQYEIMYFGSGEASSGCIEITLTTSTSGGKAPNSVSTFATPSTASVATTEVETTLVSTTVATVCSECTKVSSSTTDAATHSAVSTFDNGALGKAPQYGLAAGLLAGVALII